MRLLLAVWLASCGLAQVATSRLEGVIQDPSGGIVPGARITAVNKRSGFSAGIESDGGGLYVFLSLPPGEYTVTVEAPGFRKGLLTGVSLTAAGTLVENIRLELGPVTEAVTVEAKQTAVETSDSQIGRVVALRDIDVLPQLERAPVILAVFQPGVQIRGGNLGESRVNGTRRGANVVKIDGVDATFPTVFSLGYSGFATNTDATQEFRIVTHGGKAEYGRSAGAQVEMITRSGGNRWSGNAFDHHRNTVLNANDFFNNRSGVQRPRLVRNVFGGSLGGPLAPGRTFLFGNYQGTRARSNLVRNRDVLTAPARAGVFRWLPPGGGALQSFDIVRNDPRGRGIDPKIAELLRLLPEPNNFDVGDDLNFGGFRFNSPADNAGDQFTVRADHNLGSAVRLFFRFNRLREDTIDAIQGGDAPFPGQLHGTARIRIWGYSFGSDWALNQRTVNELRFGYSGNRGDFPRPGRLPGPMLLANSWTSPMNAQFGGGVNPDVWEFTENLSVVRGKHLLKAGLNWHFVNYSRSDPNYPNVTFLVANAPPPGSIFPAAPGISVVDRGRLLQLYNDLLGRIGQVQQTFYSNLEQFQPPGTPRVRNFRSREDGYFFQDDWKLRRNLTLNLGLRYEFHAVPSERDRLIGTVDKVAQIHNGARIGDLTITRSDRWHNNDFNNLAPRVGLAWDPRGDGKTAIRAHYGIFYNRLVINTIAFVDNNTPGFSQIVQVRPNSAAGSDLRVSDGIPLPPRPAAPVLRPALDRQGNLAVLNPNLRVGYVQHYNLTIQRELFRNTVIEAGLVGNRGVKMFQLANPNQLRIQEDFLQAFREVQSFQQRGVPVSPANALVRLFGSAGQAITTIGGNLFNESAAALVADSVDRNFFARYAAAGLSDFYLRSFPQYNVVAVGTNDGRSYYDSLQVSLRRQAGALKFNANYTWSKTLDTDSTEGIAIGQRPIDSFNLRLNRARSDFDRSHVFASSFIYTLPVGKSRRLGGDWPRWLDSVAGGWDMGVLGIWESGATFSVSSGRRTAGDAASFADYSGDRSIGGLERRGDGVFWFRPEEIRRFSFPAAGEIGSSGRNGFTGPRFFNIDASLVKRFRLAERHTVVFRGEFYNLLNNPNFGFPDTNLASASFGRISASGIAGAGTPTGGFSGGPRIVQLVLRYEF